MRLILQDKRCVDSAHGELNNMATILRHTYLVVIVAKSDLLLF